MYFQNGYTSLYCASQEGHAETAKFLISAGASLEAVDGVYNTHVTIWCFFHCSPQGGCTPLLRAVLLGQSAVVAVLIEHGCNIFAEENVCFILFANKCLVSDM